MVTHFVFPFGDTDGKVLIIVTTLWTGFKPKENDRTRYVVDRK
jgi:hypothetical protein